MLKLISDKKHRFTSNFKFGFNLYLILSICIFLAFLEIVFLSQKGDEVGVYLPVIHQSAKDWPKINLTEVSYGISPVWTWITGFFAQFISEILSGRILSFICWLASVFVFIKTRAKLDLLVFLLFINPFVFLFAMRCHPYWLGVMLMLIGNYTFGKHICYLFFFTSVSAQNFLLPTIIYQYLTKASTWKNSLKVLLIGGIVCISGITSNWLLYGGRYPEKFINSGYYKPYLTFHGLTESYFPLLIGISGWFGLLFVSNKKEYFLFNADKYKILFNISKLFVPILLFTIFNQKPDGLLFTFATKIGFNFDIFLKIAISLGVIWIFRHGLQFGIMILISAFLLSSIPFFYERYVWFIFLPIYMIKAMTDNSFNVIETGNKFATTIIAISISIFSILFSLFSSL